VLPVREELESLVHAYYHLHKEHKQAAPEFTTRRHVEGFTYAAEPGSLRRG
jgi:hypothetical protein